MCLIFMKFDTQNKSNMLIISILTGIVDLDIKLEFVKIGTKAEMCFNFYKIWHLEQIEHPNHEYR